MINTSAMSSIATHDDDAVDDGVLQHAEQILAGPADAGRRRGETASTRRLSCGRRLVVGVVVVVLSRAVSSDILYLRARVLVT